MDFDCPHSHKNLVKNKISKDSSQISIFNTIFNSS